MFQAETRLQSDIALWEKIVDAIIAKGKAPSSPVQMLTQTPLVMHLLGTDTLTGKAAARGGIYAAPHLFDGTHPNMTPDMWKQIPAAMADPIAVFDSAGPGGRARGDIVFMLELKDANGATVVVPVALEGKGDVPGVTVNIAKSAYTKENNGVPSNHWFAGQAKKNVRYINGQKMKSWQASAGVYFPFTLLNNSSGNTIYTEADLDKLKSANPGFYQSADHRQMRERQALFRTEETNSFGVPMERVTTFDKPFSRAEMEAALQQLAGRELPNYLEGVTAQVNATQRRKFKSDKAIRKSIDNGFAGGVHLSFAAKIENVWKWAARVTDKNSDFQRFVAPLRIGDEDMFAWISVKKGQEGLRIYSLELVKKEKLGQNLSDGKTGNGPNITAEPSFDKIIKRLAAPVNEQGHTFYQSADHRQMRERQTLFQTEETNSFGVPLSRITGIEGTVTREELDA
ncbi:MAG: hypothetical protein K2O70_06090, partial [Desulfovibrionaceae bacterium]|nr:hypothetical protein [Desulfovibrionaceae bacterium]